MNSRERVLACIEHKEPDRIPVDLGSTPSSGISAIAYNNLKEHLGIKTGHNRVYDVVQQLSQPEDDIIDMFGVDVIDIGRAYNVNDSDWYEFELPGGYNVEFPGWFKPVRQNDNSFQAYAQDGSLIGIMPVGATFFDQAVFPYQDDYPMDYARLPTDMDKVTWQAWAHSPWDNKGDPCFWDKLRENALYLRENTDRALVIGCGCNLFEWGSFLRRMDSFLMDLCTQPKEVEKLLDALMQIHLETLERVCKAVGDVVDILRFGDDLGMNNGPFMSPEMYRKVFKPRHKVLCEYVKKHSNMKTFLHSCGSIYRLIPDLIDAGFDILNPVQTSCFEMDAINLKKEFGSELTFWGGGCDTRHVLNHGSVTEVRDDVKRRLEVFSPGGGFVFNPIHNILPDVPPQNIIAMFDAVNEFNAAISC